MRVEHRVVAVVLTVVTATIATPIAASACWTPPVDAPVSDAFRAPSCTWCPGNRGIEYDTVPGEAVRAVATGVVTFAGVVAGVSYVVIEVAGGRRVTYGDLLATALRVGDRVVAGSAVAAAGESLHFGVRVGDRYVDPTPLLGRVVRRARLVPSDGARPRPGPPAVLRCGR